MRHEGRLSQWNDERGFGFIEPTQGADKVFVHISAFAHGDRAALARPQPGERVSFEIEVDSKGRKQARRVVRADSVGRSPAAVRGHPARRRSEPEGSGLFGRLLSFLLALAIVAGVGWKGYHWWWSGQGVRQSPASPTASVLDSSPGAPAVSSAFRCDGRQHCSQMTSCAEAKYFLRNCPGVMMDGDGDGVPCEQQWCTSPFAR